MRTPLLLSVALALVAAACVAPGANVPDDPATVGLQEPTFAPLPSEATTTAPAPTAPTPTSVATPSASPTPGGSPEDPAAPAVSPAPSSSPTTTATPVTPVRGTLSDGTGDLDGLGQSRAPAHADLREVVLTMGADQGRITIAFAGPAPDAGEGDEILNVATYHDVTGDGRVDYEIRASMTANGWGTSWFDLRAGTARYAADDDVEVEVTDGVVVLTFPPSHLDDASSGQWLASTEWGSALTISSGTSATDDAPDDRSGRRWPN